MGPSVLLLVLVVWSLLLWIAWTLIFAAGHPAFIKSQSGEAVSDAWSLVLYTGLSLVTGSLGDAAPNGPVWQLVSLVCAFNGLFLVTAGVTYLLPIVAAVSDKRRLGIVLASLGTSGEAILSRAWTGRDFDGLREHLIALTPEVALIAQRQLAYPVLHCFHSGQRLTATAPGIAALDEALTIVEFGLPEEVRPGLGPAILHPLRGALTKHLEELHTEFIDPAREPPPPPRLDLLRAHGIPTVDDAQFARKVMTMRDRWRLLLGFVLHDGWSWDDVQASEHRDVGASTEEALEDNPEAHGRRA